METQREAHIACGNSADPGVAWTSMARLRASYRRRAREMVPSQTGYPSTFKVLAPPLYLPTLPSRVHLLSAPLALLMLAQPFSTFNPIMFSPKCGPWGGKRYFIRLCPLQRGPSRRGRARSTPDQVSAQPLLQPKPRRFGDHQNTIIGKFVFCRGGGPVVCGVWLPVGRWGSLSLCNRRSQRAEGEGGSRCLFHVFHFYLGPW